MNRYVQRTLIGLVARAQQRAAERDLQGGPGGRAWGAPGCQLCTRLPDDSRTYLDNSMIAAALGVPFWTIVDVILLPILAGSMPHWTAAEAWPEACCSAW